MIVIIRHVPHNYICQKRTRRRHLGPPPSISVVVTRQTTIRESGAFYDAVYNSVY